MPATACRHILSTGVGDVEQATRRDRDGCSPRLWRRNSRAGEMITSPYANGVAIRDIEHHLATTVGTALSRETISKISKHTCR